MNMKFKGRALSFSLAVLVGVSLAYDTLAGNTRPLNPILETTSTTTSSHSQVMPKDKKTTEEHTSVLDSAPSEVISRIEQFSSTKGYPSKLGSTSKQYRATIIDHLRDQGRIFWAKKWNLLLAGINKPGQILPTHEEPDRFKQLFSQKYGNDLHVEALFKKIGLSQGPYNEFESQMFFYKAMRLWEINDLDRSLKTVQKIVNTYRWHRGRLVLQSAHLPYANLQNQILDYMDLSGVNLFEANLSGAHMYRTNLERANLQNVSLRGTKLRDIKMGGANWEGVQIDVLTLRYSTGIGSLFKQLREDS